MAADVVVIRHETRPEHERPESTSAPHGHMNRDLRDLTPETDRTKANSPETGAGAANRPELALSTLDDGEFAALASQSLSRAEESIVTRVWEARVLAKRHGVAFRVLRKRRTRPASAPTR